MLGQKQGIPPVPQCHAVVPHIIIAATVSNGKGGTSNTPSQTSQSGQTSQATGTSVGSSTHKVGDSVTLDKWIVKLNGVKTSTGSQYNQPQKAGDVFLLVDVSVTNNTGQSQSLSSLIQFAVKDASGQSYTEAIDADAPKTPDGTIANGSKLRGTLAYEIPKANGTYELDFSPALGSTDQASWSFSS